MLYESITYCFHFDLASTLKTIVELLIRSHDCFTTSCNMEGIASVLRKCQNLANVLQNLKYWTLLVCCDLIAINKEKVITLHLII